MTTADFIAPSDASETITAGTAKFYFEGVMDTLSRIYSLSSMMKDVEESRDEEDRDLNLINLLGLIEDISCDFSLVYPVRDYFEAVTTYERAISKAVQS